MLGTMCGICAHFLVSLQGSMVGYKQLVEELHSKDSALAACSVKLWSRLFVLEPLHYWCFTAQHVYIFLAYSTVQDRTRMYKGYVQWSNLQTEHCHSLRTNSTPSTIPFLGVWYRHAEPANINYIPRSVTSGPESSCSWIVHRKNLRTMACDSL